MVVTAASKPQLLNIFNILALNSNLIILTEESKGSVKIKDMSKRQRC